MEKFDFDDIRLVAATVSNINSRSEINPFYKNGFLPLFTAPMDTVVNLKNCNKFNDNKINVVLPRENYTMGLTSEIRFCSMGIEEFEDMYCEIDGPVKIFEKFYILLDVANGHMKRVHDAVKKAKENFGDNLILMAGNVANPKTFTLLSEAGANFIRVGIGNGNACTTTKQTTIGYPMASLVLECKKEADIMKDSGIVPAYIVADGGMKDYSDIILALALGADYVMVGSLFNKMLESCGSTYYKNELIDQYSSKALDLFNTGAVLTKEFRGMSTKVVQKKWGKTILKTSEGIETTRDVKYTLKGWTENFTDYLRSTMSYTDSRTLEDFIGEAEWISITNKSFKRFDK